MLFLAGFVAFGGMAVAAYAVVRTPLPREVPPAQSTILTDAHGDELARLDSGQHRTDVPLSRVPPIVAQAVVATEDRGFYNHGGIDPAGIVRAFIADVSGHQLQGGSTITQQYVKNAFLTQRRTIARKLREAVLSIKLERRYSKRQILERYLNTIYFGRGAYGVEAASQAYFGKDVEALGLQEAAFLAGIIQSPVLADPAHNSRLALSRRDHALDALVAAHRLTAPDAAAAKKVPVESFVVRSAALADPSVRLADKGSEYFVAYVTAALIRRYGAQQALGGGLRVQTTLDPATQTQAYDAVYNQVLTDPKNDPSGAVVAIDPSGAVRAMVGGRGFATSRVNLAVGSEGGGTGRQPGSTFKPLLLAEIVKERYSLLSQFPAPAEIIVPHADNGADYHVKNYEGESFPGDISLLEATKQSVNTVYAQAVDAVGPSRLVGMAHQLGVSTPLPANVSLVLGTTEVSVLEMAEAYATFMDRGVRHTPQVIEEVRAADGTVLDRADPKPTTVLTPAQADVVTYALQQVVLSGTGTAAKIGRPVAGKTGTTESYSDAWFIGYTPQLTAAVWVGYRDSKQPMLNVHGIPHVNGGSLPADIFRRFMSAAAAGTRVESFPTVSALTGSALTRPDVTLVTTSTSTSTSSTTSTSLPATTTTTASKPTSTTATPGAPKGRSPTTTRGP